MFVVVESKLSLVFILCARHQVEQPAVQLVQLQWRLGKAAPCLIFIKFEFIFSYIYTRLHAFMPSCLHASCFIIVNPFN